MMSSSTSVVQGRFLETAPYAKLILRCFLVSLTPAVNTAMNRRERVYFSISELFFVENGFILRYLSSNRSWVATNRNVRRIQLIV